MNYYEVIFKPAGSRKVFSGNGYGKTATEARKNFLRIFPADKVLHVRELKNI
jgi:hypothetical protein